MGRQLGASQEKRKRRWAVSLVRRALRKHFQLFARREKLACGGLDAREDWGVDGLKKAEHHEGEAVGVEGASSRVVEVDM